MSRLVTLVVLLICTTAVHAAAEDDTWMSVLLDGRKIGSMHTTRTNNGDHVITTQSLNAEMDRAGIKIALSTSETNEETSNGEPLGFESRTKISGIESVTRGHLNAEHKLEVSSEVGGAQQTRSIEWPKDALLAEGLRLAEMHSGLASGTHFSNLAFQSDSLDAVEIDSRVGDTAPIDLPDGQHMLTRIEQTIKLPGAPTTTVAWVDHDQNVQKLLIPVMGYELTMLACSKSCAMAPNQSADILVHSLLQAPAAISADELRHGIKLVLSATEKGVPLQLATTDEQQVRAIADTAELRIAPLDATSASNGEDKPVTADTRPNDWLQSDAPEVRALAKRGAGDAQSPHEQMQRLEQFVRGYISSKDLSVGYASALEVAKNPVGDCTEHAVLLAALGRSLGIATRVVDGLAYVDHYAGHEHVFVPHAWAQAYVDGHWQSFDAALYGFDAGHIALAVGDGDPWKFFAGFNTLGQLQVRSVDPLH